MNSFISGPVVNDGAGDFATGPVVSAHAECRLANLVNLLRRFHQEEIDGSAAERVVVAVPVARDLGLGAQPKPPGNSDSPFGPMSEA